MVRTCMKVHMRTRAGTEVSGAEEGRHSRRVRGQSNFIPQSTKDVHVQCCALLCTPHGYPPKTLVTQ